MSIEAVVTHSGGMDSSLCLALAVREFGADHVLSLGFKYGQRHDVELEAASTIANWFGVRRLVVPVSSLEVVTNNALMDPSIEIAQHAGEAPNTLVLGRNGLMARLSAIHAAQVDTNVVYMGIIGVEAANSGYRDCTRAYMDLMEQVLRIDLDDPNFEIRTPLVDMTKMETMELGHELGCLEFLLRETVTCYEGEKLAGCRVCPACLLRNEGLREFSAAYDGLGLPFVP